MIKAPSVDIVPLRGGLDLASTVLEIPPGFVIDAVNFEPELGGGYRRTSGYERVDGRSSPADAVYYTVVVGDSSGISVGATLTGGSSGATSKVVIKDDDTNTLGVTDLDGSYTLSETANGTTIVQAEVQSGQVDNDTDNAWQLAAEDYYRNLIGALPGDGDALYGFRYGGTYYGFRADGAAVKLYESTSSGWSEVAFYDYIFFDGGTLSEAIAEGTDINGETSGATATVKKFVKNGGSYSSDASGYMVIEVTSGTFQDDENIRVSTSVQCVADGTNTAISMAAGGTFQHIEHNFYASASTRNVYGCDGVNPAWEFDGETLAPIFFPAPDEDPSWNKPTYIEAHRTHLFLAFETGQIAHSGVGEPLAFSALLGAAEFGLGDKPTGMRSRAGNVLALYTRNKTYGLYGTSGADWELRIISETFGAKDRTVQSIGTIYAFEDKGIAPLDRVESYGDFESATVSRAVKPILDFYKNRVVGTAVVRERNQYRIFFDDGVVLVMTFDSYVGATYPAFSKMSLAHIPTFVSNSEDENGNEVILFGDEDGYIYRMEVGYNFDGEDIEYALRTSFLHQNTPHLHKSYKKLFIDVDAPRSLSLSFSFELSFGDFYLSVNNAVAQEFSGGGGYYDVDNWDEIYWDAEAFSSRSVRLSGSGKNIGLLVYGKSNTVRPFTLETVEIHYLPRRTKRGS